MLHNPAIERLQDVMDRLTNRMSNECASESGQIDPVLYQVLDDLRSSVSEQFDSRCSDSRESCCDPNLFMKTKQHFIRPSIDAPTPIKIHAEDGEVLSINKIWTELTGYELADIPTISIWTELAYGTGMELVRSHIDKLYERNERLHEGEFSPRMRNGETRTWEFNSAPLGVLPDNWRLVISMALDVTLRKQAEDAIKHANENLEVSVRARTADLIEANIALEQQITEPLHLSLHLCEPRKFCLKATFIIMLQSFHAC